MPLLDDSDADFIAKFKTATVGRNDVGSLHVKKFLGIIEKEQENSARLAGLLRVERAECAALLGRKPVVKYISYPTPAAPWVPEFGITAPVTVKVQGVIIKAYLQDCKVDYKINGWNNFYGNSALVDGGTEYTLTLKGYPAPLAARTPEVFQNLLKQYSAPPNGYPIKPLIDALYKKEGESVTP